MSKKLIDKKSRNCEPYQELANAIIIQAAADYREAKAFLKEHPHTPILDAEMTKKKCDRDRRKEKLFEKIKEYEDMIVSVEKFLTSPWAHFLSEANTDLILKRLQEEEL